MPGAMSADAAATAGARGERPGGRSTLDSPPLNLFDQRMIDDLRAAIDAVAAEPPRALLIRAEGRAVSGGVDVHVFAGLTPEQGSALWDELLGMIDQVEALPAPVVFAAHALTLTAAFELALACDLIVAAPKAKFGLVEKVVGLTPSMGGTQRLAERAGSGRARHFVMTGGLFGAEEMERWGVVNLIFEDEDFDARGPRLRRRAGRRPDQGARDDQAHPAPLPRRRHPGRRRGGADRSRPSSSRPRTCRTPSRPSSSTRPRPRRVRGPLAPGPAPGSRHIVATVCASSGRVNSPTRSNPEPFVAASLAGLLDSR